MVKGSPNDRRKIASLVSTVRHTQDRLTAAREELAVLRRIVEAARQYAQTGDDRALLRQLELEGWEDPPRAVKPPPRPTRPETKLGDEWHPLHVHNGIELL